jgi:TRAP-type C4-dicarboxylate transport system permease small subunit
MKKFIARHKNHLLLQAFSSSTVISVFVYIVTRILFYEFPMSWMEEIVFFLKITLTSCCIIATATGGSVWFYRGLVKMKRV